MQKRLAEDLGRKEAIKDNLPSGWTVFFGEQRVDSSSSLRTLTLLDMLVPPEKDPLQPSKWQSLTGKQSPSDWEEALERRLANDEQIARAMRQSGICILEEDWSGEILSHRCVCDYSGIGILLRLRADRMVQAMLSGCVVATVTPSMFKSKPTLITWLVAA